MSGGSVWGREGSGWGEAGGCHGPWHHLATEASVPRLWPASPWTPGTHRGPCPALVVSPSTPSSGTECALYADPIGLRTPSSGCRLSACNTPLQPTSHISKQARQSYLLRGLRHAQVTRESPQPFLLHLWWGQHRVPSVIFEATEEHTPCAGDRHPGTW
jgi:hypothetical protein